MGEQQNTLGDAAHAGRAERAGPGLHDAALAAGADDDGLGAVERDEAVERARNRPRGHVFEDERELDGEVSGRFSGTTGVS